MRSNLEILQLLGRQAADSVALSIGPGDTVSIDLRPMESAWYLQQGILAAFEKGGKIISRSPGSRYTVEFGVTNARIAYLNKRQPGLFEGGVVDRLASLDMDVRIENRATGNLLLNTSLKTSYRDTIAAANLDQVENPGIPATHGSPPGEGFFNSLVEPFVVVGAIAVAIYLLFHVRS